MNNIRNDITITTERTKANNLNRFVFSVLPNLMIIAYQQVHYLSCNLEIISKEIQHQHQTYPCFDL